MTDAERSAIEAARRRLFTHGPDRVVINAEGEAVRVDRAFNLRGIKAEVVFVRDDGWTLGAPTIYEHVAYDIWKDQWVAFMRTSDNVVRPIKEYEGE